MSKLWHAVNLSIIAFMVIISAAVVYVAYLQAFDNRVAPVVMDRRYVQTMAHAGGTLRLTTEIDRRRQCVVSVQKSFKNLITNATYDMPVTEKVIQKVEVIMSSSDVQLPDALVPGPYVLQYQLNYYCNVANLFFGPIVYTPAAVFFEIVEDDIPIQYDLQTTPPELVVH